MILDYSKEFVCGKLPTRNCHASTVLPMEDGRVVTAWFGGTKEKNPDVDIWYCLRDERGFGKPVRISYSKHLPHWNPVLFRRKNGDIILYFKVGRSIQGWRTFYCISADGGLTFGKPEELVKGSINGRGPVKNKCLRLESGRILAPASTEKKGWKCFIDISDDDGLTFRKSKTVPTEYAVPVFNSGNGFCKNKIPMIQPTLWESEPGKVHMLTRTAAGRIYRSDSEDAGETWCEAYPTPLPNNNSGIDLVKTPDGSIYLVSNPVADNWGERSPLTLSLSKDNGRTFETIAELEKEKEGSEFSYPAIEYMNGSLFITYTWERKNIAFWKIDI